MEGEMHLINSLAFDSEQISDTESIASPIIKYEVSGWNNLILKHSSLPLVSPPPNRYSLRKQSENPSPTCIFKTTSPKPSQIKSSSKSLLIKSSPEPMLYKISKINLNDKQEFLKDKYYKKLNKKNKLPVIKNKNFTTALVQPKKRIKLQNLMTAEIIDVLRYLKPENKNPVKSILPPRLLSKSVVYNTLPRKKRGKRSANFVFSDIAFSDPIGFLKMTQFISNKMRV